MAPEQAEARTAAVGRQTDVYGLGALLYELLTGRPPFQAESPLQTLQQVVHAEPARPVLLNPAVPRDLETVCLKCLGKEPGQRYASADGLADDLGRWLRGEPVQARRVGPLGWAWRWCRRQRLAAGLLAGLVLVVVASATVILYQWRQAVLLARQEHAARHRAEDNLAIARQLVSELARIGTLPQTPEYESQLQHQREALLKAETFCRRLLQDPKIIVVSDEIRRTLAEVYGELSSLHFHFGDVSQAQRAAEEAVAQWERLVGGEPGNPAYDLGLARAHQSLGHRLQGQGHFTRALAAYRQAHSRMQPRAPEPGTPVPADLIPVKLDIAGCLAVLGGRLEAQTLLAQTCDLGTRLLREGPPNVTLQFHLAQSYQGLGNELENSGQMDEARRCWQQARELYRQLFAAEPNSFQFKISLAQSCYRLARASPGGSPYYAEAVRFYEEAGRDQARLAEADPTSAHMVAPLAETYYSLADCHRTAGQIPVALDDCRKSVRLWEGLARKRPADANCSSRLMASLALLAQLQEQLGLRNDADTTVRQITERIDQFARVPPDDRPRRAGVAIYLSNLAPLLRNAGRHAESLRAAERCRQLYQELVEQEPDDLSYQTGLSQAWLQVAKYYWRLEDHDRIQHACQQALAVQRRVFAKAPHAPEYRALLDDRYNRLERILSAMGRLDEVLDSLLEREKLWPGNAARLRVIADALRKLAEEVGKGREQLSPEEQAERWRYLAESERVRRAAESLPPGATDGPQR
jgi:tetratricopeptide (TPR) repeat protein